MKRALIAVGDLREGENDVALLVHRLPDRTRVVHVGLGGSLGLMVLYFNPWFLFIESVDVALFVGIVWLTWPSKTMVGA
jgi:hypothetical protein